MFAPSRRRVMLDTDMKRHIDDTHSPSTTCAVSDVPEQQQQQLQENTLLANAVHFFFTLAESIEILCRAIPVPFFLATLLQLSKRTRFRVWQFLSDPSKCEMAWHTRFYRHLWLHRDSAFRGLLNTHNMHPVFVLSPQIPRFADEQYHLANILVDSDVGSIVQCMLISRWESNITDGKMSYPVWTFQRNVSLNGAMSWYFVAQAPTLGWNRMIVHNASTRGTTEPIVTQDTELFMV